ncbi:MAG: SMC-Scp complex subunit ScpB [Bacillota bacterium]
MSVLFPKETKAAIECLLFVSKEPVSKKTLAQILELNPEDILALVKELQQEYRDRGVQILEIANGYQMCTRPDFAPYIEQLYKPQASYGLSRAALETLAIIAYKQPITRAEVEAIRGVKIDSSLGTLVEKNLVREVGRKDGPGRPMLFGTTPAFLKYFGLMDLDELPDPDEFVTLNAQPDQLDMDREDSAAETEEPEYEDNWNEGAG